MPIHEQCDTFVFQHNKNAQKYKALISKHKAYILKYMARIFCEVPYVFSDVRKQKNKYRTCTLRSALPARKYRATYTGHGNCAVLYGIRENENSRCRKFCSGCFV